MATGRTCAIPVDIRSVAPTGKLRESIGIETLGGRFMPLLKKGTNLPGIWSQVFSTGEDNQSEISMRLFRGDSKHTASAHPLGTFVISGIAPMPRGKPEILVELHADKKGLSLNVVDRLGKSKLMLSVLPPNESFEADAVNGAA